MNALEYLEATKVEEMASQLKQTGYQIVVSPLEVNIPFDIGPVAYDLIATRNGSKLAMEVALDSKNGKSVDELMQRRDQAYQEGFSQFILGVPYFRAYALAEIEGLEEVIFNYLINHLPEQLAELPAQVQVESVEQVELDKVSVTPLGIKAIGNGVVEVELQHGYPAFAFPLTFDIELDHNLALKGVEQITADTSSFYQ